MLLFGDHLLHQSEYFLLADESLELQDNLVILWGAGRLLLRGRLTQHLLRRLVIVEGTASSERPLGILLKIIDLCSALLLQLVLELASVVAEVVLEADDFVIPHTDLLLELFFHLITHVAFHQEEVVLEGAKFTISDVEFINHFVSLCRHFGVDNHIDISQKLLTLLPIVNNLHLFQVDEVSVLVLLQLRCLCPLPEAFFAVLERLLAEDRDTLVEVFH